MSTTSTSFWSNLKQFLPVIEMAGNVALLASGVGAPFEPLVASLENSVNPLLQTIGTGQPVTNEVLAALGASIGVLTTLKNQTNLDPAVLTKVNEYLAASQDALAGYMQAQAGFNPQNYQPVQPIA